MTRFALRRDAEILPGDVLRATGGDGGDVGAVTVRIARDGARAAVGHVNRGQDARAVVLGHVLPQSRVQHSDGDALAGDSRLLQRVSAHQHGIVGLISQSEGRHALPVLSGRGLAQGGYQRRRHGAGHGIAGDRRDEGQRRAGERRDHRIRGQCLIDGIGRAAQSLSEAGQEPVRGHLPIREDMHAGCRAQSLRLLRVEVRGDGVDDPEVALDLPMHPQDARAGRGRGRRLYDVDARCGVGHGRRGAEGEGQNQAAD